MLYSATAADEKFLTRRWKPRLAGSYISQDGIPHAPSTGKGSASVVVGFLNMKY
jgi:hypothetical protein